MAWGWNLGNLVFSASQIALAFQLSIVMIALIVFMGRLAFVDRVLDPLTHVQAADLQTHHMNHDVISKQRCLFWR